MNLILIKSFNSISIKYVKKGVTFSMLLYACVYFIKI